MRQLPQKRYNAPCRRGPFRRPGTIHLKKRIPMTRPSFVPAAVALTFALAGAPLHAQQPYETPETQASALVGPALLSGPDFQVAPTVEWEGVMPRFTINSKYGSWQATGREMLAVRVSEIPAFGELDKVSKSDAFAKSLGDAAVAPVKVVGDLITNPVDTVGNIFSGIGGMVNRAGRTVGNAGQNASDGSAPKATGIGNQGPTDQGTAQPGSISDPFGYNSQRRDWARKVNIDPYTSNAALSAKLGDVASASFLGGFTMNVTIGLVVAPLAYANTAYQQGTLEAYQYPPVDVEMRNEARLKAIGIEGRPVRDFFRNRYFTPTLQTTLVSALESLGNVEGRSDVIVFATNAVSEVQARFVISSVLLLAQSGKMGAPLARLRAIGNLLAASTGDGKLVVAAPFDLVPWTKQVEDFARREDLAGPQRSVLVAGAVTPRARQEFAALGWSVSENLAASR
jgi:hypothetical protein